MPRNELNSAISRLHRLIETLERGAEPQRHAIEAHETDARARANLSRSVLVFVAAHVALIAVAIWLASR